MNKRLAKKVVGSPSRYSRAQVALAHRMLRIPMEAPPVVEVAAPVVVVEPEPEPAPVVVAAAPEEDAAEDLSELKVSELRRMAKARGAAGVSKMKKAELLDFLG